MEKKGARTHGGRVKKMKMENLRANTAVEPPGELGNGVGKGNLEKNIRIRRETEKELNRQGQNWQRCCKTEGDRNPLPVT